MNNPVCITPTVSEVQKTLTIMYIAPLGMTGVNPPTRLSALYAISAWHCNRAILYLALRDSASYSLTSQCYLYSLQLLQGLPILSCNAYREISLT